MKSLKEMLLNKKATLDEGGGSIPINRPTLTEIMHKSNMFIASFTNGRVKTLKDRYCVPGYLDVDQTIDRMSFIISERVFKGNDLPIFKEGLKGEIKEAIKETIKQYHTKRG